MFTNTKSNRPMLFVENHAFHLNNSLNGSVLRDDLEVRLPTYHESHPAKVSNQYHGVQHVRFIFIFHLMLLSSLSPGTTEGILLASGIPDLSQEILSESLKECETVEKLL